MRPDLLHGAGGAGHTVRAEQRRRAERRRLRHVRVARRG